MIVANINTSREMPLGRLILKGALDIVLDDNEEHCSFLFCLCCVLVLVLFALCARMGARLTDTWNSEYVCTIDTICSTLTFLDFDDEFLR